MDEYRALFSPELFRQRGHAIVDLLAFHLEAAHARATEPVMPRLSPAEAVVAFPAAFPTHGDGDVLGVLTRALLASTALHHPGFVGHQVATPMPDAALLDFVAAFLNNGMAVFEMGPAASAMERAVLAFLAQRAGLPAQAGGVLTSGGSLGNLTALLAARQAVPAGDLWRRGMRNAPPLALFVPETAHYSLSRSARIMGLGDGNIVPVRVDARFRVDPTALDEEITRAKAKGRLPVCAVVSAGSTAVGALDPIAACADVCARHGVWLHVDGAHGASLVMSEKRRALLAGIERADSLVWDAHKLMMMPALVTAVLFKDAARGAAAFAQEAGYLYAQDGNDDDAWSDIGKRTVECTKRMMALKLYATLQAHGTAPFAAHVDHCCDLATALADRVRARPALELLTEPMCNIVCFRPRGKDGGQVAAIRNAILAEGHFYIVQVRMPGAGPTGGLWLRTTLSHPLTTGADLDALLDAVERVGS